MKKYLILCMIFPLSSSFSTSGGSSLFVSQGSSRPFVPSSRGPTSIRCALQPHGIAAPAPERVSQQLPNELTSEDIRYIQESRQRTKLRENLVRYGLLSIWIGALLSENRAFAVSCGTLIAAGFLWHYLVIHQGSFLCASDQATIDSSNFFIGEAGRKGLGLFSKVHIPKGTFVMSYLGERIDDFELHRRYFADPTAVAASYIMKVTEEEYIDASDASKSNFARYINHADHPNLDKFVARKPGGFVNLFANRDIEAGEELSFNYGRDYWIAKGFKPE